MIQRSNVAARAANTERPEDSPTSWWVDAIVFTFVLAIVAAGVWFARRSGTAYARSVEIDLSWWTLPGYSLLSFLRGLLAYLLSLAFTIVYGTIAAKNARAEKLMIPLLDVLQGIPVLGFLPALVLGMISLFPDSNVGLEIACVVMIFTGQVWNMTFSFYGSLRAIPTDLIEVSRVCRSSWWRRFTRLELPASAIGLVWNSMVSMAGGWFFLMINEAFQLNQKDYRLPGLGAYMSVAYEKGDRVAIVLAILAMVLVIVASDQLIWRPLVVWSQKFRLEEIDAQERPRSFVYDLLRRSRIGRALRGKRRDWTRPPVARSELSLARAPAGGSRSLALALGALGWIVAIIVGAASAYGTWKLARLFGQLSLPRWGEIGAALGLTSLRTLVALAIATAWTVPVGVAIGLSPRLSRQALAVVQVLASFPAPMLFPLLSGALVDRCGVPFPIASTILTLFGAQWYLLFNVIAGAMSIPTDLREVARVTRSRGWRRWKRLILPAIFPAFLTGLITAAGGAWNASIVTEYQHVGDRLLVADGLGSMISRATDAGDYPMLAASVASLTIALVLLNRFVWKRLYRFSDERFSFNR